MRNRSGYSTRGPKGASNPLSGIIGKTVHTGWPHEGTPESCWWCRVEKLVMEHMGRVPKMRLNRIIQNSRTDYAELTRLRLYMRAVKLKEARNEDSAFSL